MKWLVRAIVCAGIGLSLIGCSNVPAGHVGIKVKKYGGDKGVSMEELTPGRYWIGMYEELFLFPTFTQNGCWTRGSDKACGSPGNDEFVFQTVEGLTVSADIGITYSVDPSKVPVLFQKYRKGIDEITDVYLRNIIRDALVEAASTRTVEDLYGKGKIDIMGKVETRVREFVLPIGLKVESIYWIGEIRLPQAVIASLNAKIAATQMAQQRQNEVAQAKAEADKKIEEARGQAESILAVAKAQAEANLILAKSLTPELVQYNAIQRWNGEMPRVNSGAIPLINLNDITGTKK